MTDSYRRFAGLAALATAAAGIIFTVTFAIAVRGGDRWALWASSIALIAGGLLAIPVIVALADQLGTREPQFARIGLVLGLAASLGTALHGAWDTAVLAHPVGHTDVPSYTDPRGFATFALTALAFLLFGWLILRDTDIPRAVGRLAVLAAVLLLVVYFGRLIVLNPKRPAIKWVAVVSGLVVSPAFYVAYARSLLTRARRGTAVVVEARTPQEAVR
jgi:hypothetical protein